MAGRRMGQAYVEAVLCAVERIPPGRVLSYGDVAELVGTGGPRQVGQIMATHGGAVPWWRVVRANGSTALRKEAGQLSLLVAEGCPLRPGGERVDMARARWDGVVLARPSRISVMGEGGLRSIGSNQGHPHP